ncbi:hypothetical protein PR002_g29031 [Phytophthora rubi]|uniref:Integrase catalytic domain-containing protein n=1 Tax=Phytophthora rubi TaxID=129364 RepID=A0A6A3H5A1_9STRA|nr:hypothetical protein PR002_g29031 [Phytophthora rubi]
MPRMEALRRTPAESREVLCKASDGVVTTSGENGAGGRQDKPPKAKQTAVVPQAAATMGSGAWVRYSAETEWRPPSKTPTCRTGMQTLQLTDEDIAAAKRKSRLVQRLLQAGEHKGMKVERRHGLVLIITAAGQRVVLPPELWPVVFKECHDFVWAGHLRAPHIHARIAQVYWWPALLQEVKQWVRGCQECGSRKARSREIVPPLRSIKSGDVGDRWALDVAGPLPTSDGGPRYVIAALEYVTRYAVAVTVKQHTFENVAEFLMKHVVLRFGPFRELLTDGAPELTGKVIEELVVLLQAQQINPVPYRPQMIGLVERFHRTWKDCVATYMHEDAQRDWGVWVDFAAYAYNSGQHSTVKLSPNELMMGRALRSPNELLRSTGVSEAGELTAYHRQLLAAMKSSRTCAELARTSEQERQAKYYNRKVRNRRTISPGDRVWMFKPPRGAKASKFVHQWLGPLRVVEPAGYDNFLVEREDVSGDPERFIAHVSFLVTNHTPVASLQRVAADIEEQLLHEDAAERRTNGEAAAAAPGTAAASASGTKRRERTVASPAVQWGPGELLVELRRRRRRNKAGHYVLEYELRPARAREQGEQRGQAPDRRRWVSVKEYDGLFQSGRVVEDSGVEEGV